MTWKLTACVFRALISSRVPSENPSLNTTWRDYSITSLCASIGPLIAAYLAELKFLGRKHTMGIGAIVTAAFFFGYTAVKTSAQNLALSCCICKIYFPLCSESYKKLILDSYLHQCLLRNPLCVHRRGSPLCSPYHW
jgi:hypothetical protein